MNGSNSTGRETFGYQIRTRFDYTHSSPKPGDTLRPGIQENLGKQPNARMQTGGQRVRNGRQYGTDIKRGSNYRQSGRQNKGEFDSKVMKVLDNPTKNYTSSFMIFLLPYSYPFKKTIYGSIKLNDELQDTELWRGNTHCAIHEYS